MEKGGKGEKENGEKRKKGERVKGENRKRSNNKTLLTICITIIDNNQSSVRHNHASVDRQC